MKEERNIIYTLDSYKHMHGEMLPDKTHSVYAYGEARAGAMYDYTISVGIQPILIEWLEGVVITTAMIDEAEPMMVEHFKFNGEVWKREKWDYLVREHGGKLPIRIKAVPEGMKVGVSNALYTIEALDKKCAWLGTGLETLIQQSWYPTTVATRAHYIMSNIKSWFKKTVDDEKQWLAEYYLHSFGQRACSCMEQAKLGGMAELISIRGTDTVMGMRGAMQYYGASIEGLGYSVIASEHSVMCSRGKANEFKVVMDLIKKFPNGILSVVSDTYDIEAAVRMYCKGDLKDAIMNRNGKFVVRPDSPRFDGDTPEDQVLWIVQELEKGFGCTVNAKGYKVLDEHVGVIYGDSLTENDINNIFFKLYMNGYSAENCVMGCGGYLLSKLNRDTQRFAIKASAICIDGEWSDIYKSPKDTTKASKKGRLAVAHYEGCDWVTTNEGLISEDDNQLQTVFENGVITKRYTFDEVRANAWM